MLSSFSLFCVVAGCCCVAALLPLFGAWLSLSVLVLLLFSVSGQFFFFFSIFLFVFVVTQAIAE